MEEITSMNLEKETGEADIYNMLLDEILKKKEQIGDRHLRIGVVCGAGASYPYKIDTFTGKKGLFHNEDLIKDAMRGLPSVDSQTENYYSLDCDNGNYKIYYHNRTTQRYISCDVSKLLSTYALQAMPELFYSFLGNILGEDVLSRAETLINADESELQGVNYIRVLTRLKELCNESDMFMGVVTLNIDSLLDKVGLSPCHIHGKLGRNYCNTCGREHSKIVYKSKVKFNGTDIDNLDEYVNQYRCECGGFIRPAIILLDEEENQAKMNYFRSMVKDSDILLVIGLNENNHSGKLVRASRQPKTTLITVTDSQIVKVSEV